MTETTQPAPEAPAAAPAAAPAPAPAADPMPQAAPTLLSTPPAAVPPAEGQAQQGSEAAKAEAPPDYSALALPDGVAVDADTLTAFKALAGESGMAPEAAQKLLDLHLSTLNAHHAAQADTQAKLSQSWAEASAQDAEIGGANAATALGFAKQAVQAFGSPELVAVLESTGLGNHPEVIRAFARAGKAMAEDGRKAAGGSASDPLRALYPSMYKD